MLTHSFEAPHTPTDPAHDRQQARPVAYFDHKHRDCHCRVAAPFATSTVNLSHLDRPSQQGYLRKFNLVSTSCEHHKFIPFVTICLLYTSRCV